MWPDTWPEELEVYRDRSQTINMMTLLSSTVYEIPFTDRDDFEGAWPHILRLLSDGGQLILVRGPLDSGLSKIDVGVQILGSPQRSSFSSDIDGSQVRPGPPWPDSARLASGDLPEYVQMRGGTWVPAAEGIKHVRARQDIVLVCDGKVVDLNRIALPADTLIVDKRFLVKSADSE
jgi:hypothetical protein